MKQKVIEAAGKIWWYLGEKGQTTISTLPRNINEDSAIVYQALGWLAREDKIEYAENNKKLLVSLIGSEIAAFKNVLNEMQTKQSQTSKEKGGNNRIKTFAASRVN